MTFLPCPNAHGITLRARRESEKRGYARGLLLSVCCCWCRRSGMNLLPSEKAEAVPAWARKYGADCSTCHYPVAPRLNSFGQQFRMAGYRMSEEFGKEQDVTKVGDFLSLRLRSQFAMKTSKVRSNGPSSPTTRPFSMPGLSRRTSPVSSKPCLKAMVRWHPWVSFWEPSGSRIAISPSA